MIKRPPRLENNWELEKRLRPCVKTIGQRIAALITWKKRQIDVKLLNEGKPKYHIIYRISVWGKPAFQFGLPLRSYPGFLVIYTPSMPADITHLRASFPFAPELCVSTAKHVSNLQHQAWRGTLGPTWSSANSKLWSFDGESMSGSISPHQKI